MHASDNEIPFDSIDNVKENEDLMNIVINRRMEGMNRAEGSRLVKNEDLAHIARREKEGKLRGRSGCVDQCLFVKNKVLNPLAMPLLASQMSSQPSWIPWRKCSKRALNLFYFLFWGSLFLLAIPAAFATAPLRVIEPPPRGATIDGRLTEWTMPPSVVIGPSSQVAGKSKVKDEKDFSARVWVALAEEGMLVAGDVRDDQFLPATSDAYALNSDHVEVWLAFPEAKMPPIGFGRQGKIVEIRTLDDCAPYLGTPPSDSDSDVTGCYEWYLKQQERRRLLKRLFIRQYFIAPGGLSEKYFDQVRENRSLVLPEEVSGGMHIRNTRFVTRHDGCVFEALIPTTAFPASAASTIESFRLLIDFVDNDHGHDCQESFLSSSGQRRFGAPNTYNVIRLRNPMRYESKPPIMERFLKESPYLFYLPDRPVGRIFGFANLIEAYQMEPNGPSPSVISCAISREPIIRLGDVNLFYEPHHINSTGFVRRILSFLEDRFVDQFQLDHDQMLSKLEKIITRRHTSGYILVLFHRGRYSASGTGPCGACDAVYYDVLGVDNLGRIRPIHRGDTRHLMGTPIQIVEDSKYFAVKWKDRPSLLWHGSRKYEKTQCETAGDLEERVCELRYYWSDYIDALDEYCQEK